MPTIEEYLHGDEADRLAEIEALLTALRRKREALNYEKGRIKARATLRRANAEMRQRKAANYERVII